MPEHRFDGDARVSPTTFRVKISIRQEGGQDAQRVGGPGGRGEREHEGDEKPAARRCTRIGFLSRFFVRNILYSHGIRNFRGTTFSRSAHLIKMEEENP